MSAIPAQIIEDPLTRPVRVMVVDDAVVVRGLVSRWLIEAQGFDVVATCAGARQALAMMPHARPDIIILDIEMPDLDGLTALPMFLEIQPDVCIIVASSLGEAQAGLALRCLHNGAKDFIAKPGGNREVTTSQEFRRDLLERVRVLGQRTLRRAQPPAETMVRPAAEVSIAPGPRPQRPAGDALRPSRRPALIVIGASTGGPMALSNLLGSMKMVVRRLPVLVVQHMPATFTPIFAEYLRRHLEIEVREVHDRELIVPGQIYIAPGGRHLKLEGQRGAIRAALDDGDPVNYCRPSVDVLFQSAAEYYGASVIAMVLTGMGQDGANGSEAIHGAGGTVLIQDEASSVVWGMPGAVHRAGVSDGSGSLPELARMVSRLVGVEPA